MSERLLLMRCAFSACARVRVLSPLFKTTTTTPKPGDGFIGDKAVIAAQRLYDPEPFFNELLLRAYRGRTLLAPHLYGPSLPGGSTATVRLFFFGLVCVARCLCA